MHAQIRGTSALSPTPERQRVIKKKVSAKKRRSRALKTIVSIILASVMAATLLYNFAAMVEISNDICRLKNELEDLRAENTRKKVEIDASIDLGKIEQEALRLGMRRPEKSQTVYLASDQNDYAEVLEDNRTEKGGAIASIINSIWAALSYLN